jgi:hypothetical protein
MSGYVQTNQANFLPDAAYTLTAAQTGELFLIPVLASNRVITLPAAQAGLHYRFMAIGTLSHTATLTPATTGLVNGILANNNAGAGSVVAKTAANTAVLTATAVLGDFIDVYCDGTAWHVSGMSQVAAGLS